MRFAFLVVLFLVSISKAGATSYLIELPEKLSTSCFIARVRITEAANLNTSSFDTAFIRAEILDLFKGSNCKEISFSSVAYAELAPSKLHNLKGKEFIIFLHDPYEDGKFWLFEGPNGLLPIKEHYTEGRLTFDPDLKFHEDTYSYEQYLNILRNWKSHIETRKK